MVTTTTSGYLHSHQNHATLAIPQTAAQKVIMEDKFSTFFQPAETMLHTSTAMEHVSSLVCLETIAVSIERSVHENFNHGFW